MSYSPAYSPAYDPKALSTNNPIAVEDSYSVTDGTTLVVNVADGILDNDTYNCT